MASPRRGDAVSVPCRGCGRTFLKVTVVDGAHPLKCASCGRTTTVRIKCKGESCQVMTEAASRGDSGKTTG